MSTWRRMFQRRPFALMSAGVLVALLSGDRAQLAPPPGIGIDPFEVLDQQVRNNVLIVLDTSGSMKWPSDRDNYTLGADDPGSRMFQAKAAIRAVVQSNQNRVNFGLVSYNALSTDKNINETQDFEADGRVDGPFIYVTADGSAASNFFTVHTNADDGATGENESCTNVDGFFCRPSNTFANYDGANSGDVWRSFMNRNGTNQAVAYNDPFPTGCGNLATQLSPVDLTTPAAMRCRYYMQSRLIRNGVRYTWNRGSGNVTTRLVGTTAIACPAPPAGLLGHTFTPPCYQMQDGVGGQISTFYYTSSIYQQQAGSACGGGALIASVAACDANNAAVVLARMDAELPVTPAGTLNGVPAAPGNATFDYGDGHLDGDQTLPAFGLRADQSTPLAGTLGFIRTTATPAYPVGPVIPAQRNFVILVTDGDDTCADPADVNHSAAMAADQAELLYNMFNPTTGTGDFRHWGETFVVGFANAVANPAAVARLNVIAQAGSGRNITNGASTPAAAMTGSTCPAGAACRDAFFASNTQQLIDILNAALEQASSTGFFSATPSVFDGVAEYANTVSPSPFPSPFSVMNPESRYTANAFRTYRASFEAGSFKGFVKGFDPYGAMTVAPRPPIPSAPPPPTYTRDWEAGQRLIDTDRISSDIHPTTGVDHTFAELLGTASAPFPPDPLLVGTHIHRRIFTTRQNGRRLARIDPNPVLDDLAGTGLCAGGPCRVNLWPPDMNSVVQPAADYTTPGILDSRLFRKADGTQMTITDLMAVPLRACQGANLPLGCTSLTPSVKLAAAQKEAREMIIAFTAGAEARRTGMDPTRNATSKQIVYRRRNWLLAESTLGTPALVTQPSNITPTVHTQEYLLYRDGPRDLPTGQASSSTDSFIKMGFGLRNPDRDGREVPVGPMTRTGLKPSMSMVLVPSNDMLHAFRAGPCPTGVSTCTGGSGVETGGEELWAFVPHDLLPSLKDKMKTQTRTDHTYMIATSLRTADVFVPGVSTLTVTGKTYNLTGRWRRLLLFGRGMGGKYYSALDITGIGSLTNAALGTQLPGVLWNRGNPDTNDGLLGSAPINGTAGEYTEYLDMGMSWSTPAVARVNPVPNGNREFVAYVGSGYSTTDNREGTRFYTLDPMSGDIIASADVGEGLQPGFQNALVANPVIYSGQRLVAGIDLPHAATPVNESVFIGDIHGRLWKFDSNAPGTALLFRNLGPDQPIGVGAALLNLGAPHVFVETGHDARVSPPPGEFKMFGFKDAGPPYPVGVITPPLPAPEFGLSFPAPPAGKGNYRGTLQPLTAFRGATSAATGVVFFTGTRFNPVAAGRCVSSFDTIVFGLVANTGGISYATTEYTDSKAVGLTRPPIPPSPGPSTAPPFDEGTGIAGNPPRTDPPPSNKPGGKSIVKTINIRPGSTVCR